jgi:Fe-S-cluster-containing dehydrogenase component/formate-dependent nitrite reductase membrane component NrfD
MRYGFVIDHNRCIGCHACTVACKEEHNVPVGVFRTWVKYIEKGEFPNTSRHFGVMRCNHCDAAPCVEICPTTALFRRDDGIVDFDNSRCIGCKSCMQACPYDALYIDPDSHTAAKCNFCAHRIELNLEPACVVVCPTRAIMAGDLDDPESQVSHVIATQKVASRKPHKGTQPKLFYVGIEGDFLQPTMMQPDAAHAFADQHPEANQYASGAAPNGTRSAPGTARVVYDVAHPQPWGWIPAFYLWTKSIAAGVLIVTAALMATQRFTASDSATRAIFNIVSPAAALIFTAITAALLIADLQRPERFYYILIKPNPRSWLVWGTWILIAYSAVAALWFAFGFFTGAVPRALVALAIPLGLGSACYSAFLFGQAKGRDLWHSPLFLWHLAVRAIIAGAAAIIVVDAAIGGSRYIGHAAAAFLIVALALHACMILSEAFLPKAGEELRRAARLMTHGKLRGAFWGGAVGVGALVPLVLLCAAIPPHAPGIALNAAAAIAVLAGLLTWEHVWITAGQAPPLS